MHKLKLAKLIFRLVLNSTLEDTSSQREYEIALRVGNSTVTLDS